MQAKPLMTGPARPVLRPPQKHAVRKRGTPLTAENTEATDRRTVWGLWCHLIRSPALCSLSLGSVQSPDVSLVIAEELTRQLGPNSKFPHERRLDKDAEGLIELKEAQGRLRHCFIS